MAKVTKHTPIKAIRLYCLECSNGQPSVVKNCHIKGCYLYDFRLGKNPNRKGVGGMMSNG